jgi:hypothetical protein
VNTGRVHWVILTMTVACGGPPSAEQAQKPPSATGIEHYFPLSDGFTYTYETVTDDGAKDMSMVQVRRTDPRHAELRTGSGIRRLEVTSDAIRREGSGYVLRAPLNEGARWEGDNGGTTVVREANVKQVVPAGTFEGCVRTEEEVLLERARITVVYCPGVGIVRMDVEQDGASKRFELRSYGSPAALDEAR